mmetsp:Transcript_110749/g.312249  ORF Transcript_110749/g.312249 Transcript_110749/m.312249 type:complete len:204 (+) Transcript_110749:731-1342(+)
MHPPPRHRRTGAWQETRREPSWARAKRYARHPGCRLLWLQQHRGRLRPRLQNSPRQSTRRFERCLGCEAALSRAPAGVQGKRGPKRKSTRPDALRLLPQASYPRPTALPTEGANGGRHSDCESARSSTPRVARQVSRTWLAARCSDYEADRCQLPRVRPLGSPSWPTAHLPPATYEASDLDCVTARGPTPAHIGDRRRLRNQD